MYLITFKWSLKVRKKQAMYIKSWSENPHKAITFETFAQLGGIILK